MRSTVKDHRGVRFKPSDRVRWVRAFPHPEYENAVGTVIDVVPNDASLEAFTMYDVEFQFGKVGRPVVRYEAVKAARF